MDEITRIKDLNQKGFFCSQIILLMGLQDLNKDNPDLVRSAHGLAGGLGFNGYTCGALTGGVCLLGLYAGKGKPVEEEDLRLFFMITDLVKWFKEDCAKSYPGINCADIIGGDANNIALRCPPLVQAVYQKVRELLVANGYDLSGEVE